MPIETVAAEARKYARDFAGVCKHHGWVHVNERVYDYLERLYLMYGCSPPGYYPSTSFCGICFPDVLPTDVPIPPERTEEKKRLCPYCTGFMTSWIVRVQSDGVLKAEGYLTCRTCKARGPLICAVIDETLPLDEQLKRLRADLYVG